MGERKTIDGLLREARRELERVSPREAWAALEDGAVLVDVRSEEERERQGYLTGAVHHPLSVVLWRLDPDEPAFGAPVQLDARVMLICREGFCSSLAAAQLREIGFTNATDVIGGVDAWIAAGLPIETARTLAS